MIKFFNNRKSSQEKLRQSRVQTNTQTSQQKSLNKDLRDSIEGSYSQDLVNTDNEEYEDRNGIKSQRMNNFQTS